MSFNEPKNVRSGKEATPDSYKLQLRHLFTHVISVWLTGVKGKISAVLELSKEAKKKEFLPGSRNFCDRKVTGKHK